MLLYKKNILYLILFTLLVYFLFYVSVLSFKLISINSLVIVKYFIIAFMLLCLLLAIKLLWSTKKSLLGFSYLMITFFFILFFISSIFTFKIEDIFFWSKNKGIANEFFRFSFWMLGMNYIFALPYLIVLIIEIVFFIKFLIQRK